MLAVKTPFRLAGKCVKAVDMAFCAKPTKLPGAEKILLPKAGFYNAYAILVANNVFSVFVFSSLRIGGA